MINELPTINWVTRSPGFSDYRPSIQPDGYKILFERTSLDQGDKAVTKLCIVENLTGANPYYFLKDFRGQDQTRPDWAGHRIVFNVAENEGANSVWTINEFGYNLTKLDDAQFYIYPQWLFDNDGNNQIVVMNNRKIGDDDASPRSTLLNECGGVIHLNISGKCGGEPIYAGMPAVFPNQGIKIAFAGQPKLRGWDIEHKDYHYNQFKNYIFINDIDNDGFTCLPMEGTKVSTKEYDKNFQGRAPAVSPCGQYVVFESNRDFENKENYALYLFKADGSWDKPKPLTDGNGTPNAQHPKFFSDGNRVIFCAKPSTHEPMGIAWIDVSQFK
ncbi:hypothetical protein [Mucilaginibacter jinjuensis]|uniref:WD40 repeat protein n=1 Tax=Mucilaginibacter jinjuensis TaxID=1176721 RepID=A0ABY7TDU7_9SPHI|nr:hypothetical protein [Mucilaginibacter jinjuensis]WCT14419.1 hypothetical protein PQO05_10795 [Mucilaginibacter jinjuensis]